MSDGTTPPAIALRREEWKIVRDLLQRYVPDREVWAFGSRVRNAAKPYSDLDLAILGDEPLLLATRSELVNGFSESDLTFKVDIVDWATTSENFRRIIDAEKFVLQQPTMQSGQPSAPTHV